MNQDDPVCAFYDKLNILLLGARSAVMEENPTQHDNVINLILKPLEDIAIRIYIRGLSADIAHSVRNAKPQTLENRYREAVDMENDLDANLLSDRRYKDYPSAPRLWEREEYAAAQTPQPRNRYHDPSHIPPHNQQYNQ